MPASEAGVDRRHAVVVDHEQHVGVAEVLDHDGAVGGAVEDGGHHRAVDHAVDQAGGEGGGHERPGHQAGAEGLVHEHGLDGAEADAALVLGEGDAEGAELGQLGPRRPVEATGLAEGAHGVDVEAVSGEAGDHLLEGLLVVGEGEVHG